MSIDLTVKIPAAEKLLDMLQSGIASVFGPLLATWVAKQRTEAKKIEAKVHAEVLQIEAEARASAIETMIPTGAILSGAVHIGQGLDQKIEFQMKRRMTNIVAITEKAEEQLEGETADKSEVDHEWAARFFSDAQDVSSEQLQILWARVLVGQIVRPGSTSRRTLDVLRNLDVETARLFTKFCSVCVFFMDKHGFFVDGRVPNLYTYLSKNGPERDGLGLQELNRLFDYELLGPTYQITILGYSGGLSDLPRHGDRITFRFQDRNWVLNSVTPDKPTPEAPLDGVALGRPGLELAHVVDFEKVDGFTEDLRKFLQDAGWVMTEVNADKASAGSETERADGSDP